MLRQFGDYDIEFEFVSGIDWSELTEQDLLDNVDSKYLLRQRKWKQPLIQGELACWLAHCKVWKSALNNGLDNAIAVFEDDCRLTDDAKSTLIEIEKLIESPRGFNFDIIFLYNGKQHNSVVPVYRLSDKFTLDIIKYDSTGAVGYVISRRAMEFILTQYPYMDGPIDMLMHSYWKTGLKTYMLSPSVVFHGDHSSPHHSYACESYDNEPYVKQLGIKSSRHGRTKTIQHRIYLLLTLRIPRRLAFRKRKKSEQIL